MLNEKILLVGDTNHDSEVAEALRIDCILIYSECHQSTFFKNLVEKLLRILKRAT